MTITIETSRGVDTDERRLALTPGNLASAIDRLDGESTTLVTLEQAENSLHIAGGPDRFAVTVAMGDNDVVYDLVGDMDARGSEQRVIGGQLIDQPIRLLVPKEAAIEAATQFAETATVDVSTGWEEQRYLSR